MLLTAAALLNEACDGRCARQKRPSSPLPLPSPPGAPHDGQSTAYTKEELAYSLAQICFLNCSCTEPAFATPPLYLFFSFLFLKIFAVFFLFPCTLRITGCSKCAYLSPVLSHAYPPPHPTTLPIIGSSSDGYCASSGGERNRGVRGRDGGAGNLFGMLYCRNKVVSLQ